MWMDAGMGNGGAPTAYPPRKKRKGSGRVSAGVGFEGFEGVIMGGLNCKTVVRVSFCWSVDLKGEFFYSGVF